MKGVGGVGGGGGGFPRWEIDDERRKGKIKVLMSKHVLRRSSFNCSFFFGGGG